MDSDSDDGVSAPLISTTLDPLTSATQASATQPPPASATSTSGSQLLQKKETRLGSEAEDSDSLGQDEDDDDDATAKQLTGRTLPPPPSEQHFEIPSSLWRLYVSHGLTAWSLRMWEFAAALLLMYVKPNSLALPSALQLTIGLASALGSTSMGTLVDRLPRLAAARRSLLFNKLSFAAAAICVYIVLIHWGVARRDALDTAGGNAGGNAGAATTVAAATTAVSPGGGDDGQPQESASFWLLVVGMMLLTAVGHLAYAANRLSVEKDWVLTLLQDDTAHIARANAVLRRIDLSCKLLAPMAAGFVMTFAGPKTGALTIALWNLISTLPELHLLQRMYSNFPALHQSRAQDGDGLISAPPKGLCARMAEPATVLYQGWRSYAAQITLRPGLALALLYGSMLGMGPVMTAYAYSRGMTEATLGGLRGVGAVFGITATFIFAPLQARVGLARTGLFAIWAQLATLVLCLVSAALAQPWFGDCHSMREDSEAFHACHRSRALELGLLMSGTILARMGLWLFDLTVSQLLQQCVPKERVGTINGVQNSLNMLFEISAPLLAVIMSDPEDFPILTIISFSYIAVAAVLYTSFFSFVRDNREADEVAPHAGVLFSRASQVAGLESDANGDTKGNGHNRAPANGLTSLKGASIKAFAIDDSDSEDISSDEDLDG